MKQTNLKSDKIAELLDKITLLTGESKVDALGKALEERLQNLEVNNKAERTLRWLETSVWIQDCKAPSKEELEILLSF